VFGGHTHDGLPEPVKAKNVSGNNCLVANVGSNGKYVGVMDFYVKDGKVVDLEYNMLPIITHWLPINIEMQAYIDQIHQTIYFNKIIESRTIDRYFNPDRVGKTRYCRQIVVSLW